MRDFTKFFFFVKGVIESGTVIKYGDKILRNEMKMHFNRLMASAMEMEKAVHKSLGPATVVAEEETNHALIELVWKIFEMEDAELELYLDHLNAFDFPEKEMKES